MLGGEGGGGRGVHMCKKRQRDRARDREKDRHRDKQRDRQTERGGGERGGGQQGYKEAEIAWIISHFIISLLSHFISLPCSLTITTLHIHTLQLVSTVAQSCDLLVSKCWPNKLLEVNTLLQYKIASQNANTNITLQSYLSLFRSALCTSSYIKKSTVTSGVRRGMRGKGDGLK